MNTEPKLERTNVWLEKDAKRQLAELAKQKGLKMADLIREAIRRYLQQEGQK